MRFICSDCSRLLDLCFVVDASASICDSDPNYDKATDDTCDNWKSVVKFVHDVAAAMTIGADETRVALVLFATRANMRWPLTR